MAEWGNLALCLCAHTLHLLLEAERRVQEEAKVQNMAGLGDDGAFAGDAGDHVQVRSRSSEQQ